MNEGVPIPPSAHGLLDAAVPCVLTSLRAGGEPDSVYVWCGRDGDELSVNAGEDTSWLRHIRRDATKIQSRVPLVTGLVIAFHIGVEPRGPCLAPALHQVRRAADGHEQQGRDAALGHREMIGAVE